MLPKCLPVGIAILIGYSAAPSRALASNGQSEDATSIFAGIGVAWLLSAVLGWTRPKLGLLITAVMAIGVSLYLGQQHFDTGPAICDVGSNFSCSDVNQSKYSEIFGVPLAYLGASYYGGMLMLAFFALRDPRNQRYFAGGALLFLGGLLTVLLSAVLAYISVAEIGKWCLFCVALYGFNAFATIAAWRWHQATGVSLVALWGKEVPRPNPDASEGTEQTIEVSDDSWTPFSWAALAVLFITMLTAPKGDASAEVKVTSSGQVDLSEYLTEVVPMELDGSEPLLGNTQAMFQILEFADFECPHCGQVAPQLKQLVKNHDDTNLRFKQYPLSNICNPNIGHEFHKNACTASAATECAHLQGKFWQLSERLFKSQKHLSRGDIAFQAERVGLDLAAFTSCMDDSSQRAQIMAGIASDISVADKVNVTGTPSIYLRAAYPDASNAIWYKFSGSVTELEQVLGALRLR